MAIEASASIVCPLSSGGSAGSGHAHQALVCGETSVFSVCL
jgi:hypothetical protein